MEQFKLTVWRLGEIVLTIEFHFVRFARGGEVGALGNLRPKRFGDLHFRKGQGVGDANDAGGAGIRDGERGQGPGDGLAIGVEVDGDFRALQSQRR